MRTRTSPYAGSGLIRFVAGAALIIGVGAAVAGIAFWVNGLTHVHTEVGDSLLLGLGVGIGGFLLRLLLLSIAEGRPFEPANARRLAVIAGLIGVIGTLSGLLPQLAGILVLDRIGQAGPDSPFVLGVHFPLLPMLALPVVLALAEAFRRGAALADDMAGLV